jgi:hypothetical protein
MARRNADPTPIGHPIFAEPQPTADPTRFRVRRPSDDAAYQTIDELNAESRLAPLPFPSPRGGVEPVFTLADALGADGADIVERIAAAGQLVFHSVGDTGSVRGLQNQELVADKMLADFDEEAPETVPQFFFHLGDVIYNFGEAIHYYDQFYDPYHDYPAPIVAIAGNHDGMIAPGAQTPTLEAFLQNFCATEFEITPEAGGLSRTAQIQPGVFFTFEAPLLRILALYSNVLENPGVIASPEIGDAQLGACPDSCWREWWSEGWPAQLARASLPRLCAVQISAHSAFTLSKPRNRNCLNPLACLICPNTGSTTCFLSL